MLKTKTGRLKMKLNSVRKISGCGLKIAGVILAPCSLLERAAARAFKRLSNVPVPGCLFAAIGRKWPTAALLLFFSVPGIGFTVSQKVAVVNPDYYRILKFGYLEYLNFDTNISSFVSTAYVSVADSCSNWPTNPACWTGYGGQEDFIGAVLSSAGYTVDYYTADTFPSITTSDYGVVFVQDPLTDVKVFPRDVETTLPDLLEKTTSQIFTDRLKTYFNGGGKIVLVGDAVKLLEDSSVPGKYTLGFGKTVSSTSVPNDATDAKVSHKWLFTMGMPFCCNNRTGSGSYMVEPGSLLSEGTKLSDLYFFNGCDVYNTYWSETSYLPTDATSYMNVRVQGSGQYVLSGAVCNPTVYTDSVNSVVSGFIGYTTYSSRKVFYIGSDTFWDYDYLNYNGAWHCGGENRELKNTFTSKGKEALVRLTEAAFADYGQDGLYGIWNDGFESYSSGSFPSSNWTSDANGGAVDGTVAYTGSQSLKMTGQVGGCWGGIAYRTLQTTAPYTVETYIRPGSESLSGCHQDYAGVGLRKGTTWANPSRVFLTFKGAGQVEFYNVDGTVVSTRAYTTLTWYKVRIQYERETPSIVKLSYWLDDVFVGQSTGTASAEEDNFDHIELQAGEGSAWFDEVSLLKSSVTTLSWTGETNYTADGLDPETGGPATSFVYRVTYMDADNEAPGSGYPKIHVKKGGSEISGSPFTMTAVDSGDNIYSDGKLYTYSTTLAVGTDYTYYFEAQDVNGTQAIGTPTTPVDAPDVTNNAPALSWTGETNYTADGLDPETGDSATSFVYRVKYTDADSDAPASGYPKVYVLKGGTTVQVLSMNYISGANSTGAIYSTATVLSALGADYSYHFEAYDVWNATATGALVNSLDAPDVTNNAPTLAWTGETNYTDDGLNPETGGPLINFVYRVKYTDADNDAPASGYPKVYVLKSGTTVQVLAMEYISGANNTGAVYSTATVLSVLGADYSYHFEAYDVWNATATGVPANPVDAPDVANNTPTISWTGETNYTADGLNPETGDRSTSFVYRVKYTDSDNDAPANGYPKVHIKKGGSEISGSPVTMTYVSGANNAGAIYTIPQTLSVLGTDYTYYFEAQDEYGAQATGTPTSAVDAPDVANTAPTLDWTGEANYTNDGLNPETGDRATSFVYRVKYIDADNDGPSTGYPKLYILKGGATVQSLVMDYVSGTNSVGAIYSTTTVLSSLGADYSYYFAAYDVWNATATGAPATAIVAPAVTNNAPTLNWTGETNYTADGLDPETGGSATSFVYRVKYTDADNDAPGSGYPKAHIKKGGSEISGSPFTMTYVSGANNTGAIYTYSTTLALGTDYTYYFEAQDEYGAQATGTPTSAVDAPDVANNTPTISWTGETNYAADGLDPETGGPLINFVYRVKYTDADNDAPGSGSPKVHIKKGGVEISGSPFIMTFVSGANNTGAVYTTPKTLATWGTDYTYYFEAQDVYGANATGVPTTPLDAPDVSNIAPTLGWTGEANYSADGLNPETGDVLVNFSYRVKYTDADNDAPGSGYPKAHIKKGGSEITGSPFTMTFVSGANNTGAIYAYSTTLTLGTDYTYSFEAQDVNGAQATGAPASAVDAPDIGEIVRQEGFKTTIGDNLFRPRSGGTSKVKFHVPSQGTVSLKIYSASLKLVRTLYEGTSLPGDFQKEWDGRDDRGHYVAPDVYFLHYIYPGGREVRKIGVKK